MNFRIQEQARTKPKSEGRIYRTRANRIGFLLSILPALLIAIILSLAGTASAHPGLHEEGPEHPNNVNHQDSGIQARAPEDSPLRIRPVFIVSVAAGAAVVAAAVPVAKRYRQRR